MDYLPIFVDLKTQQVLVVGGGKVALRKASLLLRAGARLRVVTMTLIDELEELLQAGNHDIILREFCDDDLLDVKMVVAATNNSELNQHIYKLANASHLPVNVVDNPDLCSFIFPAIVDRSPVVIAVSSGGKSPVLARLLRARIESFIPSTYGLLAKLLGEYRETVKLKINSIAQRMRFWEDIINGPVAELAMQGKVEQAQELLLETLDNTESTKMVSGEVYLVGAGPGDPDLLTFRALRLMQKADVVLFDRLVSTEILNMTRQDAEKIHVGKQRLNHAMAQEKISQLLVTLAQQGKRVLRLKGGDPFIFGRGGEEIEELAAANIPFQIVPGITAASGCATYAGIPLTHRDYSQSVSFVTGHLRDGSCDLDWPSLVKENQTIVFYMGLISLPIICSELIHHGRAASTPIALIQQGTTVRQKVFVGTLATLAGIIAAQNVQAPTLIIVGEVVNLHKKLAWKK